LPPPPAPPRRQLASVAFLIILSRVVLSLREYCAYKPSLISVGTLFRPTCLSCVARYLL